MATRWSNTLKGRSTWAYCKDVGARYACDWEIDHYVTQYLTGHGKYNDRRQDFYNELEDNNPREHSLEVMADTTKRRRLFRLMKDISREKKANENELENEQD